MQHSASVPPSRFAGNCTCRLYTSLTVENQGPSIDPEDLSQIFKRVYRADPARNTSGSYGLGLSIAEKTVQLPPGKIEAESRDGINRFWVELPCVLGPGVQGYGFRL